MGDMKYLKKLVGFLSEIIKRRTFELVKKDFQVKYLGSYLGIFWAFLQPSITILIFWFVFQVGFKIGSIGNYPYILWLLSGMIPWFFVSESIAGAANAITENAFLVKKVVFKVSILPLIKILSSLCIHLFFVAVMFIMFVLYGFLPNIYNLQVFYYLFATVFLVLSVSWITSSLVVFIRDIGQVIGIILQFMFWMTPIFWNINTIPAKYQMILKLNPVFYIVEGYRNALIDHKWFWQGQIHQTIYFWSLTTILFIIGALTFKKLRPHFADVL